MFGRSKINQEEIEQLREQTGQDQRLFAQLEASKQMFDAGLAEIDGSYRQLEADVAQARENMKNASLLAEENIKVEAALSHGMNGCKDILEEAEAKQLALIERLREVSEEAARLVEENKHFTSPSKYLNELPAGIRAQNHSYIQSLNQMADYGKQMGVLALNAAIEAGRMGESGMQFVTAAEDIRSYAANYDKSVRELKMEIEKSNQHIAELEEQVKRLVSLLKDNNVSTARLMKTCNSLTREAERNQTDAISREVAALKNQVTILKNADEEIIKAEERNRMQMEDLLAEFASQQTNQREILEMFEPVFRYAIERGKLRIPD